MFMSYIKYFCYCHCYAQGCPKGYGRMANYIRAAKAIPIIIFVSHYRRMAKPISQSGEKKKNPRKKNILKCE